MNVQRISMVVTLAGLLHGCYLPANSGYTAAPSQAAYQPSYQAAPSESAPEYASESEEIDDESQPAPYYAQPAPQYREPYAQPAPQYREPYREPRREHREHQEWRRIGQKECKSEYGVTECGFHCAAGFGIVRCAKTPAGACGAAFGQVTCWDPPGADERYAPGIAAECKAAYGRIECGYGCAEGFGNVQCATRPGGVCHAAYGTITCVE